MKKPMKSNYSALTKKSTGKMTAQHMKSLPGVKKEDLGKGYCPVK